MAPAWQQPGSSMAAAWQQHGSSAPAEHHLTDVAEPPSHLQACPPHTCKPPSPPLHPPPQAVPFCSFCSQVLSTFTRRSLKRVSKNATLEALLWVGGCCMVEALLWVGGCCMVEALLWVGGCCMVEALLWVHGWGHGGEP
jgi:hypothetical protein